MSSQCQKCDRMLSISRFGLECRYCLTPEDVDYLQERLKKLETALKRIRDCDFVITLPDRMDAVRAIAREALEL